ncbi:type II secretion system GspH family protein [Shewanella gelidimarina]|uniref:type IV pilin protein n=1 Tax=Shewanella gelidimarina TaxID=56813 RepID=UPI0020100E66|nr:type II secretion system protein [Shewanella gelidimarina]MCL1060261.1 type II secretion system GspH family protein [Shewanella gelidimarina]
MVANSQNKGFTLIELVVVIIVLGILAVIAVSQFIDFRRDAEVSRVKAIAGAYQQAITFSHTRWQILGNNSSLNDLPNYAGGKLDMNTLGFPLGIGKGNPMGQPTNIGQGEQGCVDLWETLLEDPGSVSLSSVDNGSDFQAYRHQADTNPTGQTQCSYVLRTLNDVAGRKTADIKIVYDSVAGTVVSVISDS